MVHLAHLKEQVQAVAVHQVAVIGQVGLVEESLRVQVHVQAFDLVVLELAVERVAKGLGHVAGRALLGLFLLHAVGVADHQRRLQRLSRLVEHQEDGIAREVVVLHFALGVTLHAEPVVLAVEIARIAGDHLKVR